MDNINLLFFTKVEKCGIIDSQNALWRFLYGGERYMYEKIFALRKRIKNETKCSSNPSDYREQLAKFARLYELDKELNSLENWEPVDEEEIKLISEKVCEIENEIGLICHGT